MSDYGSTPPPPLAPYGAAGAMAAPPPNYLVWAILTTLLCCLPLGIPSIVFSTQVNSKWALGDVVGAQAASAKAKKFAIWSAIVGVIGAVIGIALYVIFLVTMGDLSSTFNTGDGSGL